MREHRKRSGAIVPSALHWRTRRERWHQVSHRWGRLIAVHAVKGAATAAGGIAFGAVYALLHR